MILNETSYFGRGSRKKIKDEITPDVILIDSRTGFNDIFGISAFRLSDIVVGFFSIDVQTKPGLTFFLETLNKSNSPRIILVNSIIPNFAKSKLFDSRDDAVEFAKKIFEEEYTRYEEDLYDGTGWYLDRSSRRETETYQRSRSMPQRGLHPPFYLPPRRRKGYTASFQDGLFRFCLFLPY